MMQQIIRKHRETVREANVVQRCLQTERRGGGGGAILEKNGVVPMEICIHQCCVNTLIRVDSRNEPGSDAQVAQYRIQRGVPEAAYSLLVHKHVSGRRGQFIEYLRAPAIFL